MHDAQRALLVEFVRRLLGLLSPPCLVDAERAGGHEQRLFDLLCDQERSYLAEVSDGVLNRVLQGLLVLDGERLSYRALDVEQIGSVYEAMMGFEVRRAEGPSVALKPQHVVVNLGELLRRKGADRAKYLKEEAGCEVGGKDLEEVKNATTAQGLVDGLGRRVSHRTPRLLPVGALYLQPGEERRRSGSHYTPRTLTGPIVEKTYVRCWRRLGSGRRPRRCSR